jgi:pantoate--beta-alanine ligase
MTRPLVLETIAETRAALAAREDIVLVPTMGALHDGHLALVRRAHELGKTVVVSIFVNPLQFAPGEDLDKYPHSLGEDLDKLGLAGVNFVFAPSVQEMYPHGALQTLVVAGAVASLYEGASRPGHFDGVLTVVAKLLGIVQPSFVVFGQKDAQQVYLVRRMVADLSIPVRVEVVDIVRDDTGLALSSRNRYLDDVEKRAAQVLSRALAAAEAASSGGAAAARSAAQDAFRQEPLAALEYVEIVHPESFLAVGDDYRGEALALIAARVGAARLIDNRRIEPPAD